MLFKRANVARRTIESKSRIYFSQLFAAFDGVRAQRVKAKVIRSNLGTIINASTKCTIINTHAAESKVYLVAGSVLLLLWALNNNRIYSGDIPAFTN